MLLCLRYANPSPDHGNKIFRFLQSNARIQYLGKLIKALAAAHQGNQNSTPLEPRAIYAVVITR
jgi:hypothetical protein